MAHSIASWLNAAKTGRDDVLATRPPWPTWPMDIYIGFEDWTTV